MTSSAQTLRLKLGAQIAVAAGATLLIAGASFIAYDAYTFRAFLQDELDARAELIASQTKASMSFGDIDGTVEVLQTLGTGELIQSAAVCDAIGRPLAVREVGPSNCSTTHHALLSARPIVVDGAKLGQVVLRGDVSTANDRTKRFAGVVVLLMAPAMFLALLLAARVRATVEIFRAIEESLERAEAAARAKADFLANMSHEIRTPLNGMIGSTELLLESELDGSQRELATTTRRCAQALFGVVNDVLDVSRIDEGTLVVESVPVDVRQLVEAVRSLFLVTARQKGIDLELRVADDVPRAVLSDAHRLRQVLSNLVGNAVKFTPDGFVSIRVERIEDGIRVSVVDSGIGVPVEKRESIFRRFEQADTSTTREYGGSGLGLAIARGFVDHLGGAIEIGDGDDGLGSTFVVTLPCEPVEPPKRTTVDVPSELTERTVLLCEDNAVNRMVATRMLERLGCRVVHAEDGVEAIDRWLEGQFDMIFMDCQMPRLDGYDAVREIRNRELTAAAKRSRIFALTANVLPEDLERCRAAGMDGHVAKPVSIAALDRVLSGTESGYQSGVNPSK